MKAGKRWERGENTKCTKDVKYTHDRDNATAGIYTEEELLEDVLGVSPNGDPTLTGQVAEFSHKAKEFMDSDRVR